MHLQIEHFVHKTLFNVTVFFQSCQWPSHLSNSFEKNTISEKVEFST